MATKVWPPIRRTQEETVRSILTTTVTTQTAQKNKEAQMDELIDDDENVNNKQGLFEGIFANKQNILLLLRCSVDDLLPNISHLRLRLYARASNVHDRLYVCLTSAIYIQLS